MKNNKLTLAAAAAAAIMAAPIFTPAISSFAANPIRITKSDTSGVTIIKEINKVATAKIDAPTYDSNGKELEDKIDKGTSVNVLNQVKFDRVDTTKYYELDTGVYVDTNDFELTDKDINTYSEKAVIGTIVITATKGAQLYDKTGKETGQVVSVNKNLQFTAIATINGTEYYKVTDGYILKTDATAVEKPADKTPLKGTVKISAGYTAIFNGKGEATSRLLKRGTSWKVFYKTVIGGKYFYNLGGDQYILASSAAFLPASQPVPMKRVGTVHYVPGYGIQVWTEDLGLVKDAIGTSKKLPHATSWKVFARMNIRGKVYYNLGGDQWVDANYMSLR